MIDTELMINVGICIKIKCNYVSTIEYLNIILAETITETARCLYMKNSWLELLKKCFKNVQNFYL